MGIGLKENRSRRQTEMARVIPNAGPVHPLHVVCKFKLRTWHRIFLLSLQRQPSA